MLCGRHRKAAVKPHIILLTSQKHRAEHKTADGFLGVFKFHFQSGYAE